jgi:hypothetical protein
MLNRDELSQKLGCDKDSIDSCILIKASVESVSSIFKDYFALNVHSNCNFQQYNNLQETCWDEVSQKKSVIHEPYAIWRYSNHHWTIITLNSNDERLSFLLALLLETHVIAFNKSRKCEGNQYKVFYKDKVIEDYIFGSDYGGNFDSYYDINLIFKPYDNWDEMGWHYFKSSVREIVENDLISALSSEENNKNPRGFLDKCLKYYKAYIPTFEETPDYFGSKNSLSFELWDQAVERMDVVIIPSNWMYSVGKVPSRVL